MSVVRSSQSGKSAPGLGTRLLRLSIALLPLGIMIAGFTYQIGPVPLPVWAGVGAQLMLTLIFWTNLRLWQRPVGSPLIILYLVALGWVWLVGHYFETWYTHFSQSLLLVILLIVFALKFLRDSGAWSCRRVRQLTDQLTRRRDWPSDWLAYRSLPEVRELRELLLFDPTPALALLTQPRTEVRVAALLALEGHKDWRGGQAEALLRLAQEAREPTVRGAVVLALGSLEERALIEAVAEYLFDPAPLVRRATAEALLRDTEKRWTWFRSPVRQYLGDPAYQEDGALCPAGTLLSTEAVNDLLAWSSEKGPLGVRSALTLGAHYQSVLSSRPDPRFIDELKRQVADPQLAPALRLELARLLDQTSELDADLLEKLLDAANAAPLRLLAAERLLADPNHAAAIAALKELARLPNREMALSTAEVVQRRLGIDLGLALGQPLPAAHSRQAAEVTRRVMHWAAQGEKVSFSHFSL
ncbi:MAG: HEAT repeat domain-containing protein [Gemmataceae bacterium]